MKTTLKFMLPLISIMLFIGCSSDSEEDLTPPPPDDDKVVDNDITYTTDIAPIINSNCVGCHGNPTQNGAPFSLTTFSQVDSRASGIFNRTNNGTMPPSGKLPQATINLISEWIDGGKKE